MDIGHLIFISLTFVLAGFVKGVIGLGLPTVGMGLLAVVMTPAQAAALLVVPSFATNVWQAVDARTVPLLRRTWSMLLGSCVGTWGLGFWAGLLTANNGMRASIGLGIVLALYGALGLSSLPFSVPARLEPWLSPLIGVITGLVTAATGVYMIPSAPYLQAIGLQKDDLVLAMGSRSRCRPCCSRSFSLRTVRCRPRSPVSRCWRSCRRWPACCSASGCGDAYARTRSASASSRARSSWAGTWCCVHSFD
jgi:Sulfite exporter TauE/SafE